MTKKSKEDEDLEEEEEEEEEEYAIFITGCDSGFGKELVQPLISKGFTVFCGCLQKESIKKFQNSNNNSSSNNNDNPVQQVIPVLLDVTNDQSVADAYKIVTNWLNTTTTAATKNNTPKQPSSKSTTTNNNNNNNTNKRRRRRRCCRRHFYALVNNAGIVRFGLIDWATISDFKECLDVNYFGMVRMVKEFYPLFKINSTGHGRIINVTSMAGLFQGGDCFTPYCASKHAADCFTTNLRLEMEPYDIEVCCINPTFHGTPMSNPMNNTIRINAMWDGLKKKEEEEEEAATINNNLQEEYGIEYLNAFHKAFEPLKFITWRSSNVIDAIMECIITKRNPPRRLLVGIDAKYCFAPCNLLPAGMGIATIRDPPPAIMMKNNNNSNNNKTSY